MAFLVDSNRDGSVTAIVRGEPGVPGLTFQRGAFRPEPTRQHLFAGNADVTHRLNKLTARELLGRSAAAQAALLKEQIDSTCPPQNCQSHLVTVDEIGNRYSDRRGGEGTTLAEAMAILDAMPSPFGGSYASRVHFFIAPAMVTAIGAGLGPDHNLGRNGRALRTTWNKVMPALARSGGVWLEMYRPVGGTTLGYEKRHWESGPRDFAQLFMRHRAIGASLSKIHLLMSSAGLPPGGSPQVFCPDQACQWEQATNPRSMNPRFVQNGTGEFQIGSREQGIAWLRGYNAAEAGIVAPPDAAAQEAADRVLLDRHVEDPMVAVVGRQRFRGPTAISARLRSQARLNVTFRIGRRFRIARAVRRGPTAVTIPVPAGNARNIVVRMFAGPNFLGEFRVSRP